MPDANYSLVANGDPAEQTIYSACMVTSYTNVVLQSDSTEWFTMLAMISDTVSKQPNSDLKIQSILVISTMSWLVFDED